MSLSRYFVLKALTAKPMHGYEISKWVSDVTEGCCSPSEGALYPMLKEFEQGGYVDCQLETVSGRARKIYTLTDKGVKAYQIAYDAWSTAMQFVLDKREAEI